MPLFAENGDILTVSQNKSFSPNFFPFEYKMVSEFLRLRDYTQIFGNPACVV